MQYDLIYPEKEDGIRTSKSVVTAAYFDISELKSFGVRESAYEINDAFIGYNEFEKPFELWASPLFLHNFFTSNTGFFQQDYWTGVTEESFIKDVTTSINTIKERLITLIKSNKLYTVTEPLDLEDENERLCKSIRVKIKDGKIQGRYAFRFYAIEIEEQLCYVITGATIKIHKDMCKALNTRIELQKLNYALQEFASNGIDTKELFIDFLLN